MRATGLSRGTKSSCLSASFTSTGRRSRATRPAMPSPSRKLGRGSGGVAGSRAQAAKRRRTCSRSSKRKTELWSALMRRPASSVARANSACRSWRAAVSRPRSYRVAICRAMCSVAASLSARRRARASWPPRVERRLVSSSSKGPGRPRRTVRTPSACSPARTGTASSAEVSVREASRGAASRSAQRSASGSGAARAAPASVSVDEHPVPARRVEGHPLVPEVALHALDGQVEEPRAAGDRRHVPHQRGQPLEARRLPSLPVEGLAGAEERGHGAGEGREDLDVAVGEAARLVRRPEQADHLALGQEGDEHDGLRLRHDPDLLGQPGVEPRLVADVGPAAARAPQGPVLRPGDVAEGPCPLVGQPVHGERRLHGAGLRVLEGDADHGRPDEAGQPLGEHAVELEGLGDQRPVAADLVEPGEVPRARLRLLAAAGELVVGRLQAQERADLQDEGGGVDRLVEKVVGAGLVAPAHRDRVAERRHDDHGEIRPVDLAHPRARLEPAHAGQPQVEQDEVEPSLGQHLEPLLRRLRPGGRVAVQGEQVHQGLPDERVVVDEEDLGHRSAVWPPQPHASRRHRPADNARGRALY